MSIVIGLTGPTGSGKSSASKIAGDFGFQVIDCDKSAREAVEKGAPGLKALTVAFGSGILMPDGTLTTQDAITLPVLTTVEATLTVKLYKDGTETNLTGDVRFVNAENQKDFTVSGLNVKKASKTSFSFLTLNVLSFLFNSLNEDNICLRLSLSF